MQMEQLLKLVTIGMTLSKYTPSVSIFLNHTVNQNSNHLIQNELISKAIVKKQ